MNLNLALPALVTALAAAGKNYMVDAKGLRFEASSAAPQGDVEAVNTAVAPQVVSASTKVNVLRNDRPAPGLMGKAPSIIDGHGRNRKLKSATTGNNKLSIAIARPFTLGQDKDLIASFDDWSTFPLSVDGCSDYNVGLILSFSSGPDDERSKDAYDAYEEIEKARLETDGWGGCITSVEMTFANIPADEDIYGDYSTENVNWVNGPNRQFERLFRYVESMKKYDVWYLMEPDTYPKKMHWLDNLMNEIMLASPFALLGSKYDGQAWNYFADQMSLDLLHHISGNSVYNLTDPLLLNSVSELEAEADTDFNAVPYDLRLSQIILEGASGIPCPFPFNTKNHHVELPNKVDKFKGWMQLTDYDPVKESQVTSNQANHVHTPNDVEGYSLVHGKNMFLPWNSEKYGNVALVVKARQGFDSDALASILATSKHPFSEVVVMSEETLDSNLLSSEDLYGIQVVTQERVAPPYMDICEAQVTSPWFMIIDDKHAILDDLDLLVEAGSNRPLQGMSSANSAACQESDVCRETVEHAQKIYPSLDFFVLANDVLFDSSLRNKFCQDLKKTADYQVSSKNKQLSSVMEMGNHASDSVMALQYFAFLYKTGLADSTYQIESKSQFGINPKFQRKVQVSHSFRNNIVDVGSYDMRYRENAVPMFWHIPKSGGTTGKIILAHCLGLRVASQSGSLIEAEQYENATGKVYPGPESLRIVYQGVEQHLNVDVASIEGVKEAKKLDAIGSGLADVIVSPDLGMVSEHLLSAKRGVKGRAFAIFRHPVERANSLFHYLQKATWEPTYDPSLADMTIVEWARSAKAESNWLTRTLVGDTDSPELSEEHVNLAKDIIRRKFVVGLTDDMEESWNRFREYFGWDGQMTAQNEDERCMDKVTKKNAVTEAGRTFNSNQQHSGIKKGSDEWDALAKINQHDIAIYDYVAELFYQHHSNIKQLGEFSVKNTERALEEVSDRDFVRRMQDCPDANHCYNNGESLEPIRRRMKAKSEDHPTDSSGQDPLPPKVQDERNDVPWNGIKNAEWCKSPVEDEVNAPPIDFSKCASRELIRFDAIGGLTNYLNLILRVALWAAEEDACFYVDEDNGKNNNNGGKLGYRIPEENYIHDFLDRYFAHMGITKSEYEEIVAGDEVSVTTPSAEEINDHEFEQVNGAWVYGLTAIRHRARSMLKMGYHDMDSIALKKHHLRRIFKIKPSFRDGACDRLAAHPDLNNEYIALSIRRGDKVIEHELVATVDPYLEKAEKAIQSHFGGRVPTFFVATDDCTVMEEFREARPDWKFVSECDDVSEVNGFVFGDMKYWTPEQTDAHFSKFITEMIAMASAKYWIGVSTTNVSFWIYFMRSLKAQDDTFVFVDKRPGVLPM